MADLKERNISKSDETDLATKIRHLRVLKAMVEELSAKIHQGLEDKKNENLRNTTKKNKS